MSICIIAACATLQTRRKRPESVVEGDTDGRRAVAAGDSPIAAAIPVSQAGSKLSLDRAPTLDEMPSLTEVRWGWRSGRAVR
jgi:hypothetical protein